MSMTPTICTSAARADRTIAIGVAFASIVVAVSAAVYVFVR